MKTSVRRQSLRLIQGVNKKFESTRWIGQWTVRVQAFEWQLLERRVYVKAGKGAEKSFPAKGRRKRGLRKGRRRSRGGKPRRSGPPPAPSFKEPSLRVSLHGERLFAVMRRAVASLMSRVEKSVVQNGYIRPLDDKNVRRQVTALWTSQSRHFPPSYRMTFFGRSADEFIARLKVLQEESLPPPPPPLPRRPGAPKFPYRVRPPRSPPAPLDRIGDSLGRGEVLVPNSTLETHRKKDSFGPNPCEWCRAEWAADGEVGACLEIQWCVRSAESATRREAERGSQDVNRRRGRRGREGLRGHGR